MQLRTLFFNLDIFFIIPNLTIAKKKHSKNVSWSSKDLREEIAKESNLSYYYGNIRREVLRLCNGNISFNKF